MTSQTSRPVARANRRLAQFHGNLEQVFERADQAMYRAKKAGRNQVMRAD
jgi:GGDEF domain-containing protein